MAHSEQGKINGQEAMQLIRDHPELSVIILRETKQGYKRAECLGASVCEHLETENPELKKEYYDRAELEDDIRDVLMREHEDLDGNELDRTVGALMEQFEPFWEKSVMLVIRDRVDQSDLGRRDNLE